ncbi:hypothetical protein CRYUN_Cryun09bG0122000 [Craigia yunnanensis]
MAGSIQSQILSPPYTVTTPLPHRKTCPLFSFSLRINPSRSISVLIRCCKPSDETHDSGLANGLNWTKPLLNFAADNFLPLVLHPIVYSILFKANTANSASTSRVCYRLQYHNDFGTLGTRSGSLKLGNFYIKGLALFNCMPTTLSSGVALTQLAGGNSALALAMTVISNMLGILIIPFSISKFIADGAGVSVPTAQALRSLVLTHLVSLILGNVIFPLIITWKEENSSGITNLERSSCLLYENYLVVKTFQLFGGSVLRESFRGLTDFVDHNRKLVSKISAVFLSLVPWMQVSRSRSLLLMVKPAAFIVAIGMGTLLHLILLAFNALSIRSLSAVSGGSKSIFAEKENAKAALLVASQKTLPVMVAVVGQLAGAFGESGLLVLPLSWIPSSLTSGVKRITVQTLPK